ncbi:MAG: 30S ribosomal protein S6 [Clostridia bacterium]|nr:30S ribosomal protein S6 [Clostridia bacterium]
MSKTKKSSLTRYEMLFIIPNHYTEDEAKEIINKTEKLLKKNNSDIVYREYWGKKKLAYSINQNHYGYYGLCEFNTEKINIRELNRLLGLSKEILRHQIVIIPALSDEERARLKERQEDVANKTKKEKSNPKEKLDKETDKKEVKDKKETDSKAKQKTDLKDLDEKLAGIINAKDLV